MKLRIFTGIILIICTLFWLLYAPYEYFIVGLMAICLVAAFELSVLLGFSKRLPFVVSMALILGVLICINPPALLLMNYLNQGYESVIYASLIFWLGSLFLIKIYPQHIAWHKNKFICFILGILLIAPFFVSMSILRSNLYDTDNLAGGYLILSIMALVWACDSGAYFTGVCIGKNKLIEKISPNKTKEGMYGGIVSGILAYLILSYFNFYGTYENNKLALNIAAFCAIIFSIVGDLFESLLKRIVGVKDSGNIFPGHGGMLDRIDSQLAAIPIFYGVYYLVNGLS